ncbi:hypothetical protein JXO59_00405 [candidate division KSB1 bacterium]|nr:hypothetical protein [candidate division KSB1 bacterium]
MLREVIAIPGVLITIIAMVLDTALAIQQSDSCRTSRIELNVSALEQIFSNPRKVLQEEERFWTEEKAQRYTSEWANHVGATSVREQWRAELGAFVQLPMEERNKSHLFQLAHGIIAARKTFPLESVPHICAFFPAKIKLDITVYFTAFILPRTFALEGVVVNVSSDHWQGDANHLFNALIREISFSGLKQMHSIRTEAAHPNRVLSGMLNDLLDEGLATYIGYSARNLYPVSGEADYVYLENPEEITRLSARLNRLLSRMGRLNDAKFQQLARTIGMTQRTYHVVGAHMAEVIDVEGGREALIAAVQGGPLAFIATYNSLAPANQAIRVPDVQTIASRQKSQQRLRYLIDRGFIVVALLAGVFIVRYLLRKHQTKS